MVIALLSTVAVSPNGLDRWALPKVVVLGLAALVALFVGRRGVLPRWLPPLAGGAVLLLVIAALASVNPVASVLGSWPRYEGIISGVAYALAIWVGARLLGPHASPTELRFAELVMAGVASILAGFSIAEAAGLRPFASEFARPGALLGNATDQGAVAAALAVVLAARVVARRGDHRGATVHPTVLAAGALLATATVLLSGSRAALLALALGLVLAISFSAIRRRARVIVASSALVLLGASAVVAPTMGPRLLGLSPLSGQTIADRLLIWNETLEVVVANPVGGVGPSGFANAVASVHDVNWFSSVSDATVLDSPHNIVLQALVVGGPLLAVVMLVTIVLVAGAITRRVRTAESERAGFTTAVALGGAVIVAVLLTHVTAPGPVLFAALLLGAAIAVPAPETRTRRSDLAVRAATGTGILAWLLLALSTAAGEVALGVGVAATQSDDHVSAEVAFANAVAWRPWDADTPVIASEALTAQLDRGDDEAADAAARWSQLALAHSPQSLAAGRAAITTALAIGDLERAASVADAFRALYPLDPWFAHRAGAITLLQGDDVSAEKLLLLSTTLDPTREDPWLTLAFLYEQRGDTAAATNALQNAKAAASSTLEPCLC